MSKLKSIYRNSASTLAVVFRKHWYAEQVWSDNKDEFKLIKMEQSVCWFYRQQFGDQY